MEDHKELKNSLKKQLLDDKDDTDLAIKNIISQRRSYHNEKDNAYQFGYPDGRMSEKNKGKLDILSVEKEDIIQSY